MNMGMKKTPFITSTAARRFLALALFALLLSLRFIG